MDAADPDPGALSNVLLSSDWLESSAEGSFVNRAAVVLRFGEALRFGETAGGCWAMASTFPEFFAQLAEAMLRLRSWMGEDGKDLNSARLSPRVFAASETPLKLAPL